MKRTLLFLCFITSIAISAQITSTQNGNWNDTTTWVGGVVPTITDDVIINHEVTVERNGVGANANSLTLGGSPARLVVRENTKVTVTGNISLTRSVDAMIFYGQQVSGKLGTIIFGGTYTASKRTQVRKRLTSDKWFLIGNPFNNNRVDHTTEHSSSRLRDNGTVLSLASYDDSGTAGSKYTYYTNVTPLGSGPRFGTAQGYSISTSHASTPDFVMQGVLHEGSVSYTLSTGGNGFNLLGNPYLSYLNANDAADGTNNILRVNGSNGSNILTEDTIWLWDGDNDTWITKNLGDASFRIAPVQGFFVKASSASAFSFTKSMESHDETDAFLKSSDNRFEVDLSIESGKKKVNTSIRYIDNMTTDFDNGYDSSIFGGYSSSLEIYTGLASGNSAKKLAIQSLPNSDYENMVVPVGVTAEENSEITFTAEALNVPTGYKVYLEDRLNNSFTRLDEAGSEYKATVTNKSTDGRFYLHTRSAALSTDDIGLDGVSIYTINNNTLRVAGVNSANATVKLFSILGKKVLETTFSSTGVKDVNLPELNTGVYIVNVSSEKGKTSKKIVIE